MASVVNMTASIQNIVQHNCAIPDAEFWCGKRVLLTGHTGFKGAWFANWLAHMGAVVHGLALPPESRPNLFDALEIDKKIHSHFGDIRQFDTVKLAVDAARPDIVFHLAAQALVRASYKQPLATFETNVMGTANLLEALRGRPDVKVALMVTTDKVYRNREQLAPYPETAELGGHDPYSASKAASELVLASYRDSFLHEQGTAILAARAGNVIGGGDWSEDRLLPDAVRAWRNGDTLHIRRPDSVRPWQHVLEPLSAYLCLAQHAWSNPATSPAWNIGPDGAASVREVVQLAHAAYGKGQIEFATEISGPHEAGLLALDASKLRQTLGIAPRWKLGTAVEHSMRWYRDFENGMSADALCARDMDDYLHAAQFFAEQPGQPA
ncbi:CDP-glucose 4,6-dehydratase [Undibacterium sp. Ji49W]|uniref:CDP-glucose 4,6-dehydratase n=1 Tax=Undibacterium sp. Ji49W TaxID=3413040 RepID=UPI003BF0A277